MNKFGIISTVLFSPLISGGCDTRDVSVGLENRTVDKARILRVENWPADTETVTTDTIIHVPATYRLHWVTSSLNDNAVIDTAYDDQGKILIAAHNHQTKLQAWHDGKPLFTTTLTKQLVGPPEEVAAYSWHDVRYQEYRNSSFVFRAWLSVPDSDVGQEAEIAVDKQGKCQLLKLLESEIME
ncbi:DUF4738 domain-containing protein [Hymenobacter duratus]